MGVNRRRGHLVLPDPKISLVLRVKGKKKKKRLKGRIVDWRDASLKQ